MKSDRVLVRAAWRHLVMLNFGVDPEVLVPYLPRGTELDCFEDQAYVSIVGFTFADLKFVGVPILGLQRFPEVNLRFYVRRHEGGMWRRGVVFIREVCPKRLVSWAASVLYNEQYRTLPMRSRVDVESQRVLPGGIVDYRWRIAGDWHRLAARRAGDWRLPEPGSLEEFITEQYWGYGRTRSGGTLEYHVRHRRWHVAQIDELVWDCDTLALYGPRLAPYLANPPVSAFLADGSAISVAAPRRIAATGEFTPRDVSGSGGLPSPEFVEPVGAGKRPI